MDTICSLICHMINQIQATFQNNAGEEDASLDVCDATGAKGDGGGKGKKGGKKAKGGGAGGGVAARGTALSEFVAKMVDEILGNRVLAGSAPWFNFKKETGA
jgi:hypothetical protein